MRNPVTIAAAAAAHLLLLGDGVLAQSWGKCNPLQNQCAANTALGMTIDVDFRQGAVNSFAASGIPSYSDGGACFTVSRGGDAPQLQSLFYIMFGRVEITMKAASGPGIVSSLVLMSDDQDEVDIEWLGSNPDEIQSNYFGKGLTTTYNRGKFHRVPGTQARWVTYTVDWTEDRIVWMVDGETVRQLKPSEAEPDQYPQTPMQVKFGAWAGGDPNTNAAGTVEWARGPTDYSKGPFSMMVQRVVIADYSTGKQYRYKNTSGSWESIEALGGGTINGNAHNALPVASSLSPPHPAATTGGNQLPVPVGGIAKDGSSATATQTGWPWNAAASPTGGPIPDGWHMTTKGKIMRNPGSAANRQSCPAGFIVMGLAAMTLLCRWW